MNALTIFEFEGQKPVRVTLDEQGEPWWVAADVCKALGISKPENAYARLDEDQRDTRLIGTLGGHQKMVVINESGLFELILRSDKPDAKKFRRWVTSEVLPSIRKTGRYAVQEQKLTPLQQLRAMLEAMEAQEARLQKHEERLDTLEVRQMALTAGHDFYTVVGFFNLKRERISSAQAAVFGKRAVKRSAILGIRVETAQSAVYGVVNSYHLDVLEQVYSEWNMEEH